jgi:hypothetical protein
MAPGLVRYFYLFANFLDVRYISIPRTSGEGSFCQSCSNNNITTRPSFVICNFKVLQCLHGRAVIRQQVSSKVYTDLPEDVIFVVSSMTTLHVN